MPHPSEKWTGKALPDLETPRLLLRQRRLCDAEELLAITSLPEVAYPAGFLPNQTLADQRTYQTQIYPKSLLECKLPEGYVLVDKATGQVIGSMDFNHRQADDVLEFGYLLSPDFWGMGLVTEAGQAFVAQAFDLLDLHKLELESYAYNTASLRVAQKLGFQEEGRIRDRKDIRGQRCDVVRLGLLKREWEERRRGGKKSE